MPLPPLPICHTPWGFADSCQPYGDGVMFVGTPSHGGFYVDEERLKQMPEVLALMGEPGPSCGRWFEEDCDWAAVAIAFPDRFEADYVAAAWKTLERWRPAQFVSAQASRSAAA